MTLSHAHLSLDLSEVPASKEHTPTPSESETSKEVNAGSLLPCVDFVCIRCHLTPTSARISFWNRRERQTLVQKRVTNEPTKGDAHHSRC